MSKDMQILENRLDSFKKGKGKAWPMQKRKGKLAPKDLAEAGFYFTPNSENPRQTTCFLCNEQFSDWESDSDAWETHFELKPSCPWVILHVSTQEYVESKGKKGLEFSPTSDACLQARLQTFAHWPHDEPGWKCTSTAMAQGGFVFRPTTDADDWAECLYCKVSLDGWEQEDDPTHEHRRRKPDCIFFSQAEVKQAKPKKKAAPKKKRVKQVVEEEVVEEEAVEEVVVEEPVKQVIEAIVPEIVLAPSQNPIVEAAKQEAIVENLIHEPVVEMEVEGPVAKVTTPAKQSPVKSPVKPSSAVKSPANQSSPAKSPVKQPPVKSPVKQPSPAKSPVQQPSPKPKQSLGDPWDFKANSNRPSIAETDKKGRRKTNARKTFVAKPTGPLIADPVRRKTTAPPPPPREKENDDPMGSDDPMEVVEFLVKEVTNKSLTSPLVLEPYMAPMGENGFYELQPEELEMTVEEFTRKLIENERLRLESEGQKMLEMWKHQVDKVKRLVQ